MFDETTQQPSPAQEEWLRFFAQQRSFKKREWVLEEDGCVLAFARTRDAGEWEQLAWEIKPCGSVRLL